MPLPFRFAKKRPWSGYHQSLIWSSILYVALSHSDILLAGTLLTPKGTQSPFPADFREYVEN